MAISKFSKGRVLVAAVTAIAVTAGVLWFTAERPASAPATTAQEQVRTVPVSRTDLSAARMLPGTLGYGAPRVVKGVAGRVTWLPAAGAAIARGQEFYRVDDRPVTLFYGTTPLFRPLDSPNLVGRDVQVVADNLQALGYAVGSQPRVGSTVQQSAAPAPSSSPAPPPPAPTAVKVHQGDAVLTIALINAIKSWQEATGRPRTGVIDVGDIAVLDDAIRVTTVRGQPGDQATGELMVVSAQAKAVTVQVEPIDSGSIKKGDKVRLTLPNESTTPGTIVAVGTSVEQSGAEASGTQQQQRLAVTISPDDPAALATLDAAPVRVEFTGETRSGVLAVPVGALLALRGGGYAVQPIDGALIPVTTGLFAKGMVEVSGSGVAEGVQVVTTS